ncbi:MAG: hypothetical protein ACRCT5_05965 [Tannerellaceae bacterium]
MIVFNPDFTSRSRNFGIPYSRSINTAGMLSERANASDAGAAPSYARL